MYGRRYEYAMSLLELLLSMAVIAIIATVLSLSISGGRTRAFNLSTQSYLRNAVMSQVDHFMQEGEFAPSEAELLTPPARSPYIDIEAWTVGPDSFCIQAKYQSPLTSSFFVDMSGQATVGNCP